MIHNVVSWLPGPVSISILWLCLDAVSAATGETGCNDNASCDTKGNSMLQVGQTMVHVDQVGPQGVLALPATNKATVTTWNHHSRQKQHSPEVSMAATAMNTMVKQPGPPQASDKESKALEAADEPETAPKWWVSLLIFFAFAFGILFIMAILLGLFQLLVLLVRHVQEPISNTRNNAAVATRPKEDIKPILPTRIGEEEMALLMNGDHNRLDMLLQIGCSRDLGVTVEDLVRRAAKASKLSLSQAAVSQTIKGLLALVEAARDMQKKRDGVFNAKKTLRQAILKVLMMVKVCRALKIPIVKDHEERAWTCNDNHADVHAAKYEDGHKSSSGFRDVKQGKSAIGAYFASERWIDHAAIGFMFLYSQLCALGYAMYLKTRFPKMYEFMGPWLLVSRGEAMAVVVLTMLMVILLSRGLTTILRRWLCWSTVLATILDKHVLIHIACGMMLPICSILHIIGHTQGSIPAVIGETDSSRINEAFTYGTKIKFNFNSWGGALQCYPAITGYILVLILIAFWALSNQRIRRYSFELFHYPHLVLVVSWCAALIAHGWRQWLGLGVPLAAIAVAPVVLFYMLERISHIRNGISDSHNNIKICNAIIKKRTVLLEIDTGSSGYSYTTGMYCMLKVPSVSDYQWHPFTIASGGGQQKFQVLFAVVGDWTTRLSELCTEAQKSKKPYPTVWVRGGYGAPAEGMHTKKHIVMVGGGVGATPFLSFLSNICNSAKAGVKDQFDGVESAVFYWVSREPDDFVWVNQYNTTIAATPSLRKRVAVRLCLTKSLETTATEDCSAAAIALFWLGVQIALDRHGASELASELGAPTQFGRPNWVKEFSGIAEKLGTQKSRHQADPLEVSVFACGNAMLVKSLEDACDAMKTDQIEFRLYAEEF